VRYRMKKFLEPLPFGVSALVHAATWLLPLIAATTVAQAQTFKTLYAFMGGVDGGAPWAPPILYAVTFSAPHIPEVARRRLRWVPCLSLILPVVSRLTGRAGAARARLGWRRSFLPWHRFVGFPHLVWQLP
jgi:hypothetical protein